MRRSARPRPSWRRKPRPPPRRKRGAGRGREQRVAEGRKKNGKTPAPPRPEPDGKAQRNFTDPESRILKTKDGYIQGYNAQAAVDGAATDHRGAGLTLEHERSGATGPSARRHQGQSRAQARGSVGRRRLLQRGQSRRRWQARHRAYIATGRPSTRPTPSERSAGPLTQDARQAQARRDSEAATDCESRSSSRCSDRSNRQEGSGNSCCAASTK